MSCTQAREHLALLLYGDLDRVTAAAVQEHLAGCPACRTEYAELRRLRQALDALPAPAVQVDLPRLFQTAARRQARRWRRAALLVGAAAAALLLVLLTRLEVRVEAQQLVVRWGTTPTDGQVSPTPVADLPPQALPPDLEQRLQLMDDLLHALVTDVRDRDAEQQRRLARLQTRLDDLQAQSGRRWVEFDRQVRALYVAHFQPPRKGE